MKCKNPNCNFIVHSNPNNNNGKFCCNLCKSNNLHGSQCEGFVSKNNKCKSENCKFTIHSNTSNNNGKFCCNNCRSNKGHGPLCERVKYNIESSIDKSHIIISYDDNDCQEKNAVVPLDNYNKTKKVLITQYFTVNTNDFDYNVKRQKEIDACLIYNLKNSLLDEVHLLTEKLFDFSFLTDNLQSKIIQTVVGKRLEYETVFKYYNKNLAGVICILANADIFTDESIELLDYINLKNSILALNRYEYDDENVSSLLCGSECKSGAPGMYSKYTPTVWSQDAWIWNMQKITVKNANFCLGVVGCDNKIANLIFKSGYKIYNPSFLISINHYDRLSITIDNGDIKKGSLSLVRDPPKGDNIYYKSYLKNKDECIDKYTYSVVAKKQTSGVEINDYIYPHFLHDIVIHKNIINISCLMRDNFDNVVFFDRENNTVNAKKNLVKYLDIVLKDIYAIYIIDLKGKLCTKDDKTIGYVSKFNLSYLNENNIWVTHNEIFKGIARANGNFIKRNYLKTPIFCKKLRVHILEYVGISEARIRLFGHKIEDMCGMKNPAV